MTPSAIYSKSGKGVQEASGKTSILSRGDRAVLSAFDGKASVSEVAERTGKPFDPKFEQLVGQLEKDGFIREVVTSSAPAARPAAPARPAGAAPGEELDFTAMIGAAKPAAAKPATPAPPVDLAAKARAGAEQRAKEEEANSYKTRQEAEARAKAEADARAKAANQARIQAEAANKAKAEAEAKARAAAEAKAATEAKAAADLAARSSAAETEAKVRAEADARVKAAREAAVRAASDAKAKAEAEMNAKLEAERAKAREENERIRKETEEKARKEAEELRRRLEEERKAREEADKARLEAEKQAKEAEERRRKEEDERRAREEQERKAREEAEKARLEAERSAREAEERRRKEEDERRAREELERKAREEAEKARLEAERKAREAEERRRKEEDERRARDEKERAERERAEKEKSAKERADREKADKERADRERAEKDKSEKEKAPAAAAAAGGFSDSLLADLDSFGQREEEERKEQEEAERKKQEESARKARAEAERREREEAERKAKEEAERKAKEAAERKAKEEAEREAQEAAERAKREAEERKRKTRESVSASKAAAAPAAADDDIGVTDSDLDMDEVKRDEQNISKESRRAAREREREREKGKERAQAAAEEGYPAAPSAPAKIRRPMKWGKPVAVTLFLALVAALGVIHVMPVSTAEYESAASEALGVPVKIGSARVSLFTGVRLNLVNVTVGQAKIASVRAHPAVGSLFGENKVFSRLELEGAVIPQEALAQAMLAKTKGARFEVGQVVAKQVKLSGPLTLPLLDVDVAMGADGVPSAINLRGAESLTAKLAPKDGRMEFEMNANSFTLPVAQDIVLSQFGMKGTAGPAGIDVASWSGTLFDGALSGTAKVTWGSAWRVDGVVTVRNINAAVFAPALLSEGKAEGTGKFTMAGADPAKLGAEARLEGNFNMGKGVLGSIDLSRALQTSGRQTSGRTPFAEMSGQGTYDKGAIALRNVTIGAGALSAGASVDIAQGGALSGRLVADVRIASQTVRATLNLAGTAKEPQVRN